MEAPASKISIRHSYNIASMSFSPKEIAAEIKKHIPDFAITYKPDYRQAIADSWPQSIDDSVARNDWDWKEEFELTDDMADKICTLLGDNEVYDKLRAQSLIEVEKYSFERYATLINNLYGKLALSN
jgi:hypothetical protein